MLLRNKEIKGILLLTIVTILMFSLIGLSNSPQVALVLLFEGILLVIFFLIFTSCRYKQIQNLSKYLKRIRQGEHSLDIRDNEEGELSILKSEIYKVTNMLSEYNVKLKNDKVLLADNIADISHQLKTPLTSMMVMTDLLQDEELPREKRRQFTSKISSQLRRIEWLVTSLLTMSKLDIGVLDMRKEKIQTSDLIEASLEPILISLELRDISYKVYGGENIICCDQHWTVEAIVNILKNCMEHTKRGGHLEITSSDNPLYSEIKISDTGVGIKKEDLTNIFTRFYRGKNSSKDSVGIGLSMSKGIIKNQGGNITVESNVGKGSTFYVKFYKTVI